MDMPLGSEGWDVQGRLWVDAVVQSYGWVLLAWAFGVGVFLLLLALVIVPVARRRFWCVGARQAVEVGFEKFGLPGRRRPVEVISCGAFDPRTDARCSRACLSCDARVSLEQAPPAEEFPARRPACRCRRSSGRAGFASLRLAYGIVSEEI